MAHQGHVHPEQIDPASVPVTDAATILLLRDSEHGVEVFSIRRAASMVFAGGVIAFPGGGVDPSDYDRLPTAGPDGSEWSSRLGIEPARAQAIVSAAVRECFEETGMLLTSPAHSISYDGGPERSPWAPWRSRVDSHEISMGEMLRANELVADTGRLVELSRWITPVGPPRRYDTFFFGIELSAEDPHEPDGHCGEFDDSGWSRPKDMLDASARSEVHLLPPTLAHFEELAAAKSVRGYLSRVATMAPVNNDLPGQIPRTPGLS